MTYDTAVAEAPSRRKLTPEQAVRRADFGFEIDKHASNLAERKIAGYASVFNVIIPSYSEIVDAGAFTRTLASRGDRVKVLWQHNPDLPIGLPTILKEDAIGLYIEAQLSNTQSVREEYMPLLLDGVVDRMSIGFRIMDDYQSPDDGLWHLRDVELYEFSPVTFPANESAIISDVRSVVKLAKRALGIDDDRKPMTAFDAKYAMAVLMGARGAGSFADLDPQERRGLYDRLVAEYGRHSLTAPVYSAAPVVYSAVKFQHDEQSVYAAGSLRKRLVDVRSAAVNALRIGCPLAPDVVKEAEAALDAIRALGLDGVSGTLDSIAKARELSSKLGIDVT